MNDKAVQDGLDELADMARDILQLLADMQATMATEDGWHD